MFEECVIHIGTEKTGTSALQNFLADARPNLPMQGWMYSRTFGAAGSQSAPIVLCLDEPLKRGGDLASNAGVNSEDALQRFRAQLLAGFEQEISENGHPPNLIISSEHFHSRLTRPHEIQRLKELLSAWCRKFKVVLYLRRQDRVAASWYSTYVKGTGCFPATPWQSNATHKAYYYDYAAIHQNWAGIFGEDAVTVALYDVARRNPGGVVSHFLNLLGLERSRLAAPVQETANPSLDRTGLDFLRAVRELGGAELWNARQTSAVGYAVARWSGKAPLMTRQEALAFHQRYREGNAQLAQRLGLPALFDDDFDDYPEALPSYPREYYSAVEACAEHFLQLARRVPPHAPLYDQLGRNIRLDWD